MESVWIFTLGMRCSIRSISKTKRPKLLWHFLRILNWRSFLSKGCCHLELLRNVSECWISVLSNALMKLFGCVPDKISIAQITWKNVIFITSVNLPRQKLKDTTEDQWCFGFSKVRSHFLPNNKDYEALALMNYTRTDALNYKTVWNLHYYYMAR